MAGLVQKIRTFATHTDVRRLYILWLLHKFSRKEMSIDLPHGAKGFASGKFNDFYGIWVQHPTEAEFTTFAELLRHGGVYLDVGANMGLTTVVASIAGNPSRIIAFEPTHRYAAVWHKNVEANAVRNASLFQCCVGEKPGVLEFIINLQAPMHNRLNLGKALSRYEQPEHDVTMLEKIAVTTIDAVCTGLGIDKVSLLKIDVEGAEPSVLRGARHMLQAKAIDAIYMEFIPEFMREMNEDVNSFVDSIYSIGYMAFRIEGNGVIGGCLTSAELADRKFDGLNVVLKPCS